MSTYKYETANEGLDIRPSNVTENTFIWVHEGKKEAAIIIPNSDIPAVAAELLKAAGYLTGAVKKGPTIAERAANEAEKKLQERRDALAKQFSTDVNGDYIGYKACGPYTKAAIDSYIALEDGK